MKVIFYGNDYNSIIEKFRSLIPNNIDHIILLDDVVGEDNVIYHSIKKFNITSDVMFINFNTMKPAYNFDFSNILNNINTFQKNKSNYIIFFNRYLDSSNQTVFLKDLDSPDNVSLFESFNPGNSDAFFIDSGFVKKIINEDLKTRKQIFDLVRKNKGRSYSFDPNLITYNFKDSTDNVKIESSKSSPISGEDKFNFQKLNRNITLFFSDNIILFWVFIVFFICISFLACLRVFKIGSQYI